MPTRTDKPLSPASQYLYDELRRDNRCPTRLYDHWLLLVFSTGRPPKHLRAAFYSNVAYIRRRIAGLPQPKATPLQHRRAVRRYHAKHGRRP
jgi:hypothetical protein